MQPVLPFYYQHAMDHILHTGFFLVISPSSLNLMLFPIGLFSPVQPYLAYSKDSLRITVDKCIVVKNVLLVCKRRCLGESNMFPQLRDL